jgi:hypothetical protein
MIGAALIVAIVVWSFVKPQLNDPLYITYFDLVNMAGPPFYAASLIRRGSTRGTNSLIMRSYTLLVASWSVACALWFGAPFDSPRYLAMYLATIAASAGVAVLVGRMAARERGSVGAMGGVSQAQS